MQDALVDEAGSLGGASAAPPLCFWRLLLMEAPATGCSCSWKLLLRVEGVVLTARGWGPLEDSRGVKLLWGQAGCGLLGQQLLVLGGEEVGVPRCCW